MKSINLLIISILAFISFRCGNSQEAQALRNLTEVAKNIEKVGEEMEKSQAKAEERKKRGDTLAMNYKDLQKYLPKSVKGYELDGEMSGQTTNMQGMSVSVAKAKYKKGDDFLNIELTDYNAAYTLMAGLTMAWGMSMENDDEIAKGCTIKGHKGFETFKKKDKDANVVLGISDRFYVSANANNQSSTDLIKSALESIDIDALAKK
jgi:hypothetical protein